MTSARKIARRAKARSLKRKALFRAVIALIRGDQAAARAGHRGRRIVRRGRPRIWIFCEPLPPDTARGPDIDLDEPPTPGEPPDARAFLRAGGFTGIVAPGECGCTMDELMPCGQSMMWCDPNTGIPKGCQPGYMHRDPDGGPDWVVSISPEAPTREQFVAWINAS